MKKNEYRGKRLDSNTWVYGSLFGRIWRKSEDGSRVCYIFPDNMLDGRGDSWADFAEVAEEYEVDPGTVGQYTGITDSEGNKIFEGDILLVTDELGNELKREVWDCDGCYVISMEQEDDLCSVIYAAESYGGLVIGNVHDNPELRSELM